MNFLKNASGFTMIELVIVIGIIAVLFGIATINLVKIQHNTTVSAATDELVADMRTQQTKAMAGTNDSSPTPAPNSYGIVFGTSSYTLFDGASDTGVGDFIVSPTGITFSTNLPNKTLVFDRLSGIFHSYINGTTYTITLQNSSGTEKKIITVNRYGVVKKIDTQ